MTVRGRIGGFGVLIPESRSRPSAVGFTTVTDSTVGSGRHPVERGVEREGKTFRAHKRKEWDTNEYR